MSPRRSAWEPPSLYARRYALFTLTGGGKWVEIKISADPLYQHLLLTAEKKFWHGVESGEPPRLFGWWELPEKMISMRRISVPTLILHGSCRDHRILANNRIVKLQQRNGQRVVMASFRGLRLGPSPEYSYRRAFAKA